MSTVYSIATHPLALTVAASLAAALVYALLWPHGWKRDPEGVCAQCGGSDVYRLTRRDGGIETFHMACGALVVTRPEA